MTRKSTWTNADGLVVGFGPNFAERNEAGVHDTDGQVKEARLAITWESSGANVAIPAGSVVLDVVMKVGTAWVGGTSVSVGDGSDGDGCKPRGHCGGKADAGDRARKAGGCAGTGCCACSGPCSGTPGGGGARRLSASLGRCCKTGARHRAQNHCGRYC